MLCLEADPEERPVLMYKVYTKKWKVLKMWNEAVTRLQTSASCSLVLDPFLQVNYVPCSDRLKQTCTTLE